MFKFIKWLILAPILLILKVLAYPVAPFIALYSMFEKDQSKFVGGTKPTKKNFWYWMWLTYDNGIDGDQSHYKRWEFIEKRLPRFGKYIRRTAWMWRNKVYNFAYHICGIDYIGKTNKYKGTENVDSVFEEQGRQYAVTAKNDGFSFFMYKPYKRNNKRGIRIYLGWKMKNAQNSTEKRKAMMAFHINPYFHGGFK